MLLILYFCSYGAIAGTKNIINMTYYQFLLEQKESGLLKKWLQIGAPSQIPTWMEIFAYHLAHSKLSQWQVAFKFDVSKKTVWTVYRFMNQEFTF